jgi:hypothetical protein
MEGTMSDDELGGRSADLAEITERLRNKDPEAIYSTLRRELQFDQIESIRILRRITGCDLVRAKAAQVRVEAGKSLVEVEEEILAALRIVVDAMKTAGELE